MIVKFRRWSFALAILSFVLALFLASDVWAQQVPDAEQLNQDGFTFLQNGAAAEALSTWQEAEERYRAEGNKDGTIGTQLNQALAQQTLGLYPRACSTVAQALALSRQICQSATGSEFVTSVLSSVEPTEVDLLGARLLGESLTLLGNLAEAQAALSFAQTHLPSESAEASSVALAAGNVHRLLTKEAIQTYERLGNRDTQQKKDASSQISSEIANSIHQYQNASGDSLEGIKARLNTVDLFTDVYSSLGKLPPSSVQMLSDLDLQQLDLEAQAAYTSLKEDSFEQLPVIDAIYGQLNLVENLTTALQFDGFSKPFWKAVTTADIEPLVLKAKAEAERIDDKRALSFADGMTAELKALQGAPLAEVKAAYTQALAIAQSIQASDAAYEWAYELAQLEEKAGQTSAAVQNYRSAIAALTQVREDLIAVNTELRFNFKEKIEPVYRNYIKLLVAEGDDSLSQAVTIHDSLQLAQLENFLRCGRLLGSTPTTSNSVSIHVINLDSEVEVIVNNQKKMYGYRLPAQEVLQAANNLILNIQSPSFIATPEEDILPYSQLLYSQLIKPAVAANLISNSDRLSFVLDAPFRAIPMGLLHDGQKYLAATYVLSNSLQLQTVETKTSQNRALFAGVSQEAPSFASLRLSPLPETEFEAKSLEGYTRSKMLLNNKFTVERFSEEMSSSNYKIVHISTHGQFSSVPEQTYLAAWDKLISVRDMADIFQGAGSIDLLVLSACQTASDDDRSTLGLAGISIQSGAQSAIASLWLVDTTGSSVLMDLFYRAMGQGLSTAEALQQAQIELMESSTFSHPFYWAPFVLISG